MTARSSPRPVAAGAAAQPLQLLVLRGDLSHLLQHVLGQGKVVLQVEQLEDLPRVEGVRLRRSGKHLAEAGELAGCCTLYSRQPWSRIVPVERTGVAIAPLHRHRHGEPKLCSSRPDPAEELFGSRPRVCEMSNSVQDRAVRSSDADPVSLAARRRCRPECRVSIAGPPCSCEFAHPGGLVYVARAHSSPEGSHHPEGHPWMAQMTGAAIQSRAVSPKRPRTPRATPPSGRQSTGRRSTHHPSEIQW